MKAISRSTLPIPRNWWIVSVIWTALLFQMATAYISPAPHSGWDPNRNKAKAQPVSKPASESSFAEPPTNIQVEDIFREEYRDWAKRYDKKIDMNDGARFENFKMNFMLQMQQNKKTGIFYLLNEYGDLTVQEYNQLMNKGRPQTKTNERPTANTSPSGAPPNKNKAWTPSRDHNDNLSGVEVVEALAKTAQEYQNYLSRKSASANRRRQRENAQTGSNPKPPLGGGGNLNSNSLHQSMLNDLEQQQQQFMDGITTQPKVVATTTQREVEATKPKKESNGYAVMAELVLDPPPAKDSEKERAAEEERSTVPRVKPPTVQAMGTSQSYGENDAPRKRPGTLESKYFQTVKGTPSNKSFFSGIGTQFVGVSSNKRLVRWEPGMEE